MGTDCAKRESANRDDKRIVPPLGGLRSQPLTP